MDIFRSVFPTVKSTYAHSFNERKHTQVCTIYVVTLWMFLEQLFLLFTDVNGQGRSNKTEGVNSTTNDQLTFSAVKIFANYVGKSNGEILKDFLYEIIDKISELCFPSYWLICRL